jgi:enamine deaminase RidA (YjgF/YER057c/UK114 family)
MSRIVRTEANAILARAVEYHGFVYTQGVVARNLDADIKGQAADVLAQIDEILEQHGTDKTRILQAQVWLRDLSDRQGLNEVWSGWLAPGCAPARACVEAKLVDPRMLVEIMMTTCK